MAVYLKNTYTTSQTISTGADVFVTATAIVDASLLLSSLNTVHVAGYVRNIEETDETLFLGSDDITVTGNGEVEFLTLQGGDNTITNAGLIGGRNGFIRIEAGSGISSNYNDNYIVNSGTIASRDWTGQQTIEILSPNAETVIINSGTISALHSLAISFGARGGSIDNSGTISGGIDLGDGGSEVDNAGGSVYYGIFGGTASDTVRNSGMITGSLSLGDGANLVDNTTGSISGNITLGTGADTIHNGGMISGAVTLGGGSDTLDNTGTIIGAVDMGAGGGTFTNGGIVKGNVTLGGAGDAGFLDSRTGAIYGAIIGGGAGNTIFASLVGNSVTGGAGGDTVRGGIGDDNIATLGNFDFLFGRGGDDKLDGGAGGDTMYGGSGDDEYIVDGVGDLVNEVRQDGSGYDVVRVKAGIDFDLSDKAQVRGQVEDLFMDGATGSEAIDGTGNGLDNVITGNGGGNILDGKDGDDQLVGAGGSDTLRGGSGADVLDGGAGAADTADYSAGAVAGVTVALDLSLTGTGDALGDTFFGVERLRGTNFADTLRGDTKANYIFGLNGADTIDGRDGDDRLAGGVGIDTLTGGIGSDRFEFNALSEIGDIITDFIGYNDVPSIDEAIVVKGSAFGGGLLAGILSTEQFQHRADNAAQDDDDRFIFRTTDKTLWFDADGNGAGVAVMVADLQAGADLQYFDIIIV